MKLFATLGYTISRYWHWVLCAWMVAFVLIGLFAPDWDRVTKDGDFAYLPSHVPSVQGERLLEEAFGPRRARSQIVIVCARNDGPLTQRDFYVVDELVADLSSMVDNGPIVSVLSYRTKLLGEKLVSPILEHGQATLIILQLRTELMAVENMGLLQQINHKLDQLRTRGDFPRNLQLGVTGSAAIGSDMLLAAKQSISNTETTTIVLVLLFLIVVYRSPGLVLVPLIAIGTSVYIATGLVASISHLSHQVPWFELNIYKTTRIFIVVLLFGAGVDYCLFLVARYREELLLGRRPARAIRIAIARVGEALAASALTTVLGLAVLVFCSFGKFRNSGPVIGLCLAVALLACLTLAPALLRAVGPIVFWPWQRRVCRYLYPELVAKPEQEADPAGLVARFWDRLATQVVRFPALVLGVVLAILTPFAIKGTYVSTTYNLLAELHPSRPSVQGTTLLQRYFAPGEIGPTVVLAYDASGISPQKVSDRLRINKLSDQLRNFSYQDSAGRTHYPIKVVRSAAEPLGSENRQFGLLGAVRLAVLRSLAKDIYIAQEGDWKEKVARFDLVFQYDPFSPEAIRLLGQIEQHLNRLSSDPKSEWYGAKFYLAGTTAGIRDLQAVTTDDRYQLQWTVPLAVFFVLVTILRRPFICLFLLASVVLGYLVTIGASMWLFSALYGSNFHGLDWKVPIYLFVLLIAVGEDYNIYLVSRIFEEQNRRGAIEGIRVGLVRTGAIITSCGLIMAGTFASMISGQLRAMQELGFALALGMLLDTFVIRSLVVPSFLCLVYRYLPRSR